MDIVYFNSLMVGITLVAVVLAIMALFFGLFYYGFRLSGRVSALEQGQQELQAKIAEVLEMAMEHLPKSDNPGEETRARRSILLTKLRANELTRAEAMELNAILLKEEEAAKKRGDVATLIAIGLGLAVIASVLAKAKK